MSRTPSGDARLLVDFRSDVYWWEPDGRVVQVSPGDGIYFMACVHPTGEHTILWGGARGRPRLWVADGAGLFEAVTAADVSARYPAYNLGGDVLAFCRSRHPSETIERLGRGSTSALPAPGAGLAVVVGAADGSWERQVTDGAHADQRPALSPDGRRVAFVRRHDGRQGIWVAPTDGTDDAVPLVVDRPAYRPWWSVDGEQLFFFVMGKRHQLHTVAPTGGTPTPLANDDRGNTHGPYADPGGRHLIVHSTREAVTHPELGVWGLFEVPLDGSRPRRLLPPGHVRGAHATRARNGVVTFDVSTPARAPERDQRRSAGATRLDRSRQGRPRARRMEGDESSGEARDARGRLAGRGWRDEGPGDRRADR